MFSSYAVVTFFLLIVLVAVYFHTVTGFGLAMIIMGLTSGTGIASVTTLASVISIVTLVNSAVALRGSTHHIEKRTAISLILGVIPASIIGVILLGYLSSKAESVVQVLLGIVIVYGGVIFAWRPKPRTTLSSRVNFTYYGFLGGLMGGLFAIPGPPLIFHLYRQPMTIAEIRTSLIFLNAIIAGTRTLYEGIQGDLTQEVWILSALCFPAVALATLIGRRYPPPFLPDTMRRIAFLVLILMGIGLILPVVFL